MNEIGEYSLILALAAAVYATVVPALGDVTEDNRMVKERRDGACGLFSFLLPWLRLRF